MERKPFNYFAIRVQNTIVFRRTVSRIKRVRSILYKPNTEFKLQQVTYTGGRVIASMPYVTWATHGGQALNLGGCVKITKEFYRALGPYLQKGA